MNEAVGNKQKADTLKALGEEMNGLTEVKSEMVERTIAALDQAKIDHAQLAKVKDAKSKALVTQSAGHIAVAALFNAKAIDSARQLTSLRPGPADALAAPALLNTAKVVITVVPAQIDHLGQYASMLATYMKDNKLPAPSKDDERKILVSEGFNASDAARTF
jgi:hypothetical protein